MPRANKHLDDKWAKHRLQLHHRRLQEMRSTIDNKPPQRHIHLEQKLKKQQMEEERYSQIERDNYLLLDKMSYIMTHPQLLDEKYMGAPVTFGKSLNKDFRKRELMRITEENLQVLRRIQHKEPVYNRLEWEEKARRDMAYLKNCSEYPVVLPSRVKQPWPRDDLTPQRRSRIGVDDGSFHSHAGFQPAAGPVRIRQGNNDRDDVLGADVALAEERAALQSRGSGRGSSREARAPSMPALQEGNGGDESER